MLGEADSPSSSLLDYRFGWRWLLPVLNGDRIFSVGLSADELQWWVQIQSLTLVSNQAESADGYLIALDSVTPVAIANQINSATPRWLCAWGSSSSVNHLRSSLHGFDSIREYALLPAGKPRVVVPLSSPQNAVAGLRLHRPGRWLARIGLLVAFGFARLGYYGLLRRRVLLVAAREKEAMPQGAIQAGMNVSIVSGRVDYALYLGTPDDNRKTVVLPLGDSLSEAILKVAQSPKSRAALRNEIQALQVLAVTSLAYQIPKLIEVEETDCSVTLYQEYRHRVRIAAINMSRASVDFLVALSWQGRCTRPLANVLAQSDLMTVSEARAAGKMVYARIRDYLDTLAAAGVIVWGHRSHGDFAPWNCAWTKRGFFVFDWEESKSWDVALGDAFYFVIAPVVHVAHSQNMKTVGEKALEFAMSVEKKMNLSIEDIRVYWLIWLLQRTNRQSAECYDRLLEHQVLTN